MYQDREGYTLGHPEIPLEHRFEVLLGKKNDN